MVTTAHELGIRSSSTMMYGHVDHPRHWLGHFRVLAGVQDRTGGFTEFVALPFVHTNAPDLPGRHRPARARPGGRTGRCTRWPGCCCTAGSRNIQCSWVKLGDEGTVAMLHGGCNDLGGTLMEETISRMAGSAHGSARTVEQLHGSPRRPAGPRAERTTTYGRVSALAVTGAGHANVQPSRAVTFARLAVQRRYPAASEIDRAGSGTTSDRTGAIAVKRAYLSGSA